MSSVESGHDNMMARRNSDEDDESCDTVLQAAFRKLAKESSIRTKEEGIGVVLVFGEKVDDKKFLSVLRQALKDNFAKGSSITPARVQDFSPGLAFAGSRAVAMSDPREKFGGSLREKIILGRMSCELRR
jgi:hypothetical protein